MSENMRRVPERRDGPVIVWTPERREIAARMWREGHSAGQIAKAMGIGTRNAVISIVHRMGLSGCGRAKPSAPTHVPPGPRATRPSPKPKRAAPKPRPQAKVFGETKVPMPKPKLAIAGNGTVFEQTNVEPKLPPVNAAAWSPLPGFTPVTMDGLRHTSCRWPVDLVGATETHYCGRKSEKGAYCATHAARSYVPAPIRRKGQDPAKELARSLRRYVA